MSRLQMQDATSDVSQLYMLLEIINPLNAELNPICHLLALLAARHIFHISMKRVKYVVFYSE